MPLRFIWDNYFVPVTNCVSILRSYLQYIYKMRINIGQKVKIERVINNQCKKKKERKKREEGEMLRMQLAIIYFSFHLIIKFASK